MMKILSAGFTPLNKLMTVRAPEQIKIVPTKEEVPPSTDHLEKQQKQYTVVQEPESAWKNVKELDDLIVEPRDVGKSSGRIFECIALNTTTAEIKSGRFQKCIEAIQRVTTKSEITKTITFYILLNNSECIEEAWKGAKIIRPFFRYMNVLSFDLTAEEDLYVTHDVEKLTCGKYGFISGPNMMFLKTMEQCRDYNTTLLLETDCVLSENWVEKLYNGVKYSGGFWVLGASYDGNLSLWKNRSLHYHLNGVALYSTGSPDFQGFLQLFDAFMCYYMKNVCSVTGYDHAMRVMIDYFAENRMSEYYWKFVDRNMLRTQLIINCSMRDDSHMKPKIDILYDYAILHIK